MKKIMGGGIFAISSRLVPTAINIHLANRDKGLGQMGK